MNKLKKMKKKLEIISYFKNHSIQEAPFSEVEKALKVSNIEKEVIPIMKEYGFWCSINHHNNTRSACWNKERARSAYERLEDKYDKEKQREEDKKYKESSWKRDLTISLISITVGGIITYIITIIT